MTEIVHVKQTEHKTLEVRKNDTQQKECEINI